MSSRPGVLDSSQFLTSDIPKKHEIAQNNSLSKKKKDAVEILFIALPKNISVAGGQASAIKSPPTTFIWLSGVLIDQGHHASILDANSLCLSEEEILQEINRQKPDAIGFTVFTSCYPDVLYMAKKVREMFPLIKIAVGGYHVNSVATDFMNDSFDLVFKGEAEISLLEAMNRLGKKEEDFGGIPGLIYFDKKKGDWVETPPADYIADFDDMPLLPYNMALKNQYNTWWTVIDPKKHKYMATVTGKGCPVNCSFCDVTKTEGLYYRAMSPQRVVKEFAYMYFNLGITHIEIRDPFFTIDLDRVRKISQGLIDNGIKVEWGCSSTAQRIKDLENDNLEEEGIENHNNESNKNENAQADDKSDIDSSIVEDSNNSITQEQDEIGDESIENNIEYFTKNDLKESLKNYKYYTNEFDEIINAEELCEEKELEKLRLSLDQQVFSFKPLIAKIANRLQRKLLAQQNRQWEFNLEEGYLDTSRLAKVIANPKNKLSFKKEKNIEFKDTIVTLLIDNSGSMRGRPITVAALCSDILARTLERCLIKTEILGFTTKAWKGGRSREKWSENNKISNPGRLNDLRHIIYKSGDSPWRRSKKNLGLLLREGILKENIDGEALLWAYNRINKRQEKRKILVIISDGAPVDDSTLSINPGNYLEQHLKYTIAQIENKSDIDLVAIGIGHDVSRYYSKAVTIMDVDQLGEVLLQELSDVFSTK